MGMMSDLDLCIGELRNAAQSLHSVADCLTAFFSVTTEEPDPPPPEPQPRQITLEQVRAVLAEKSRSGHTAKVRELLERHGATKLSEIEPEKYAALLAEAEALDNG